MLSTILTKPAQFSERDLRGYQHRLADFIVNTPQCAAWVDMRMGKTVSTGTAIAELIATVEIKRVLVLAPDFVVSEKVWPKEMAKWDHLRHLTNRTISNKHTQRMLDLESAVRRADITVCSYTNLLWLVGTLRNHWPFDMIVLDESSAFKSQTTKRFAALSHIIDVHKPRVVQLTGTPMSSGGLLNLWPQIYLLDHGKRLGTTFDSYQKRFFYSDFAGYKWTPFEESKDDIHNRVSDLVFRLDAADHLELPPVIKSTTAIELPPGLRRKYKKLEQQMFYDVDEDTEIEATTEAAKSAKLLQFCDGAMYDENKQVHFIHELKLDALDQFLNQCQDRVLLAYNYRFCEEMIRDRHPHAVHVREKGAIDRWCEGKIDLMICHPGNVAYGLDLYPGGHTFCQYGNNWSPELTQQFEARLKHPSQPPITGHSLCVADSRDSDVIEALASGAQTQDEAFEYMKRAMELRQ